MKDDKMIDDTIQLFYGSVILFGAAAFVYFGFGRAWLAYCFFSVAVISFFSAVDKWINHKKQKGDDR